MTSQKAYRFPLGRVAYTRSVINMIPSDEVIVALVRHASGDWGEALAEDDRKANDYALERDERILSAYRTKRGIKFWIITEWDRSVTTVLLPEDY